MAASYDGDGNRVFTASRRKEVLEYSPSEDESTDGLYDLSRVAFGVEKTQNAKSSDEINPDNTDVASSNKKNEVKDKSSASRNDNANDDLSLDNSYENASLSDIFSFGFSVGLYEAVAGANTGLGLDFVSDFKSSLIIKILIQTRMLQIRRVRQILTQVYA